MKSQSLPQPRPPIHAVIFDLDGLMLNTEDIFNLAGNELMRRRNKVMTPECHNQMLGRRPHEAFSIMVEMLELRESIEDLLAESGEIFNSLLDEHLAPMPGLFELLGQIESHTLPKGVATSSPRNYLDDMLTRFDLHDRFLVTLTAEDVTHGKPHPEIYLRAAASIGVAPAQMLVLEDSEAGTRAAAAAGAVVVAVPNDHSRAQDFSPATVVVDSLHDATVLELIATVR